MQSIEGPASAAAQEGMLAETGLRVEKRGPAPGHTLPAMSQATLNTADLNALPLPELYRTLAETGLIRRLFELARDEDLGAGGLAGDETSRAIIDEDRVLSAQLVIRGAGVVAGLAAIEDLIGVVAPDVVFEPAREDGSHVHPRDVLGAVRGPARQVLALERPMLNLVGRLSGIASRAHRFVQQVERTNARVLDTRKTTPGLRVLEKYATRCGGADLHRLGLYDAVLIKDNHLGGIAEGDLASRVAEAAERARAAAPDGLRFVQVEVDTLDQFKALLALDPGVIDIVLLDNMEPALLRDAVKLRLDARSPLLLEASGGIGLETIRVVAETGVDRISVGSLTHGAVSLDVGLDLQDAGA